MDMFEAARKGNLEGVNACLEAGADPAGVNDYGFTALHCAAAGLNSADESQVMEVMQLLLDKGCPLELASSDGRTALYLAAEFALGTAGVQLLLDAGAKADIFSAHGIHIVVNAMVPEVQALLSKTTGYPVPPPRIERPSVKLSASDWRAFKSRLDEVFSELEGSGLVAMQDVGTTQEDGFSDCAELYTERGGNAAGMHGFCFYSRQDLNRAKRSSHLPLSFWGAPEGANEDMRRVGELIVGSLRKAGFIVDWNGSGAQRPVLYLQPE